jgi:hypothetical protein
MVLEKELRDLEGMMEFADLKVEQISKRGIDWHLDHCLRILVNVSDLLKKSDPKDYKWKFNLTRLYIFAKGSIPRGKARAPKAVNNKETINREELELLLNEAKSKIVGLESLPVNANFKHPYFGYINRDKTFKFLSLHTEHHYKIMKEIKAAASK